MSSTNDGGGKQLADRRFALPLVLVMEKRIHLEAKRLDVEREGGWSHLKGQTVASPTILTKKAKHFFLNGKNGAHQHRDNHTERGRLAREPRNSLPSISINAQ